MTNRTYTFINDSRIEELLVLVNKFNEALEYPNSENSGDERRYSEFFETKILELINRK
jgi:hypothetical protein